MMRAHVSRTVVGWVVACIGTGVWLYGYLVPGSPSFVDWHAFTPWWIADFLPNKLCEIGMAIALASMIPMYWPRSH